MPRRVQDILPGDRRSIRDIEVSRETNKAAISHNALQKSRTKVKGEIVVKIHKEEAPAKPEKSEKETIRRMAMTPPPAKKRSFRKKGMWLLVTLGTIVVVVAVAFVASTHYSRAVFTITPKSIPIAVNSPLVIKASTQTTAGDLSYDVITMKATQNVTVPASDGPVMSVKAEGKVNLYNAYSATSIRLIAGTRLSGDSGKVYRLKSSVVIPGYTKPAGSVVAGSVPTSIVADEPGAEYNISRADAISDLKIVAYAGGARYATVYGRLVSDVTGGATGTKKIVAAAVISSSTATMKASMTTSLLQQVRSSVPADYIMYEGSYATLFSTPTVGGTTKGSATVSMQGTVYGIILKKSNLVTKLAGVQAVSTFGDFGYTAIGLDKLSFGISNIKDFAPDKKGTLIVNVKGDLKLVGTIPVEQLKKALSGKSLADSQMVMKAYSPVIENADGELVPPWSKIPSDPERIKINVNI